jgi:hypothetical protein
MLILISGALSCSLFDGKPQLAKKNLEERINRESQGTMKLLSLEQTDGMERDLMLYKSYSMDFKAKIEIQQDCYKYYISFSEHLFDNFQVNLEKVNDPMTNFFGVEEVDFKKGDQYELIGKANFEKRDKGWEVFGVEITKASAL